jgi:hypothetical protein
LGVETIDLVADRGYFKVEYIEACDKARVRSQVFHTFHTFLQFSEAISNPNSCCIGGRYPFGAI